jgi:hypothetical protein
MKNLRAMQQTKRSMEIVALSATEALRTGKKLQ